MIKLTLVALATLVAGFIGGVMGSEKEAASNDGGQEIIQSLLLRNAELESQVSAGQSIAQAQTTALVVVGCAFAICLLFNCIQRRRFHDRTAHAEP